MISGESFLQSAARRRFLAACEGVSRGSFRLVEPDGAVVDFGEASPEDPTLSAELAINDWSVAAAVAARGDIGLGETYVEGLWNTPDMEALFRVILANMDAFDDVAHGSLRSRMTFLLVDKLMRRNSRRGSQRNIRSHYDVGNDFYALWLDETMTYSSALYDQGGDDLVAAQHRKYDRLLDAASSGGDRILEVGCGWGGFAERAADRGCDVTALTISPAQKQFADKRLGGRAKVMLQDYRDSEGEYDGIVSIEMIEAVGERYWPTYFDTLRRRLKKGGKAAIQAILVRDDLFSDYRKRSDYIRHYTFPGGMLLSVEQVKRSAEHAGLVVQDVLQFGKDYARTLQEWSTRFESKSGQISALGYDDRFQRSWRFYLGMCAAAFLNGRTDVAQFELVKQ